MSIPVVWRCRGLGLAALAMAVKFNGLTVDRKSFLVGAFCQLFCDGIKVDLFNMTATTADQ